MKAGSLLLTVAIAGAAVVVAREATSADRVRAAVARAALAADTLAASRDTTRLLAISIASLDDTLRVVQRRAVQVDQRADALDRALGLERAARDSLAAAIAGYRSVVAADTVRDTVVVAAGATSAGSGGLYAEDNAGVDTVRRATFDVRQAPYTIHARVGLPPPPGQGTMALSVDLDTLRFEVRLGCGPPDSSGVRPAAVAVTGPSWASVGLARVEQSPDVCALLGTTRSRWVPIRNALARVGVSIGYVAGVGAHNQLLAGPGATIGVKVWP